MVLAALLLSTQAAFAGDLMPNVLVTVPTLKPYTDALLKGIGESQSLLRPGQDAHTFTLSPSQRHALDKADVIILPDRGMSAVLDTLLATEEKRGAKIVVLSSFKEAQTLPYPTKNPWLAAAGIDAPDSGEEDEEEHDLHEHHSNTDPHLWLDPVRMANLAGPVAAAIAERSPSNRAALAENARLLSNHLQQVVTPALSRIFAAAPRHQSMSARTQIPFITYHAAYQYFLTRFGLQPTGEVTQRPEDYLGGRTLHDVIDGAGKLSIRCVISETDSPLVRRIATASGAKIVTLSPETTYTSDEVAPVDWVQDDYDRFLLKTANSFAECL
jgi:zinc transport system substrate-binding protein